jgi:hypothetical protein
MQSFLALLSVVAVLASVTSANPTTTYYVSSSNPAASDSNAGTAPGAPWRTLQRVAEAAPTLSSAAVLLRAGDRWVETTAVFLTGMVDVTLAAYSDVGSSSQRPAIVRSSAVPAAGPTLTINNSSGVAVQGLAIEGGENGIAFTFDVVDAQPTTYSDFVVKDCFFNDVQVRSHARGRFGSPAPP